jgi:hypothetical protein
MLWRRHLIVRGFSKHRRRMAMRFAALFLAASLWPRLGQARSAVIVENGLFYVDGEPFYIMGVGYEPGTRPGSVPWNRKFEPDALRRDLAAIRAAGFNTLRTWAPMTDQEIEQVQASGLKILMGIWIDPAGPFGDPGYREKALTIVRTEINRLKKWDCILGFLVMNEPPSAAILKNREAYRALHADILGEIRRLGEKRPVSMSATAVNDFEPVPVFDFAGFNLYPYNPVTVKEVLGYKGMLGYIKRDFALGRPLVITEFGLSVSPVGEGALGYGRNSLKEQRDGILAMVEDIRTSGLAGYCVFQWNDGWWKNHDRAQDELVHDPDPEEWFGIVGIAGPLDAPEESFRPVYAALQSRQQFFLSYPDRIVSAGGSADVLFLAPRRIGQDGLDIEIGSQRHEFQKGRHTFYKRLRLDVPPGALERPFPFTARWKGARNRVIASSTGTVTLVRSENTGILLDPTPSAVAVGQTLRLTGRVAASGGPVPAEIVMGVHGHAGWNPGQAFKVPVGPDGGFQASYTVQDADLFLTISLAAGPGRWEVRQVEVRR